MSDKVTVMSQCGACGGTGIYQGLDEPDGVGVVCLNCHGTGCKKLSYIPFTERKRHDGISSVSLSRGSFMLTGTGPTGNSISYEDFLAGKMPSK